VIVAFGVIALSDFDSSRVLALFVGAYGGGLIAGILGFGFLGHRFRRYDALVASTTGIAIGFTGFAVFDPLVLRVMSLTVAGVSSGPIQPVLSTLTHTRTPQALMGRVQSLLGGLSLVLAPVGALGGGVLIEIVSVEAALWVLVSGYWGLLLWEVGGPPMRRAAPEFEVAVEQELPMNSEGPPQRDAGIQGRDTEVYTHPSLGQLVLVALRMLRAKPAI
jgi:MFS family permease